MNTYLKQVAYHGRDTSSHKNVKASHAHAYTKCMAISVRHISRADGINGEIKKKRPRVARMERAGGGRETVAAKRAGDLRCHTESSAGIPRRYGPRRGCERVHRARSARVSVFGFPRNIFRPLRARGGPSVSSVCLLPPPPPRSCALLGALLGPQSDPGARPSGVDGATHHHRNPWDPG